MRLAPLLVLWILPVATAAIPPPGIPITDADRADLRSKLGRLAASIARLEGNPLLVDVQIFHEAVRYALRYNEFFKPEEVARARELLRLGEERAESLLAGRAPWTTAPGLTVRGYISKIDRSVQPYGIVIPKSYSPDYPRRWRLDAWFHGRSETLSEVNFLWDRLHNPGEFTPADTFVLHLYGRYCNANKFAGEMDLFEALDDMKRQYAIDENRILVRGFSMGGAAVWHFATHYAGEWAAAAPGAGFAETAEFLQVFANEKPQPAWWEQKLYHWYDATDYAANLFNTSTVAYSGEIDKQKQAADIMQRALEREGMRLTHVIGPNTAHRYHPDSKIILNGLLDAIAERGRDRYPRKVRFTTWTLRYNRMKWVEVDGLGRHWERARVDAEIVDDHTVKVSTANVTAFTLRMGAGGCPLDAAAKPTVVIDGSAVIAGSPMSDHSWTVHFRKTGDRWVEVAEAPSGLVKRHGLQGPIDDAFLDSFIVVRPTGDPLAPGIADWVAGEQQRAIEQWRSQFRGDARVRDDVQITDADIASSNLILWGDPGSNRLLARILDRLPIRWTKDELQVGAQRFPASTHAPVLIFPNPLNPNRYVVLNSGFTFREDAQGNNAKQIAVLPDYAVVDTRTPPDGHWPGRIALAGFFDEDWKNGAR